MNIHKRTTLAFVIGVVVLGSVSACSTPTSDAAAPTTTASPSTTPTPTASAVADEPAPVDLLPLLDGVTPSVPEGWSPASCNQLTLAYPAGWQGAGGAGSESDTYASHGYSSPDSYSIVGMVGETRHTLAKQLFVGCGGAKSDWDGSWSADGMDSYRLEVPGAKYAALWVDTAVPTTDVDPSFLIAGDVLRAQAQILTDDGTYFDVTWILPTGAESLDLIRATAGTFAVDE
jgi:hypothetical protein